MLVRRIIGVVVGLIAGFIAIAMIEFSSTKFYPLPEGLDLSDKEGLARHVASLPTGAFLFVLTAHAVGTFVGAFVCGAITRQKSLTGPLIVGSLLLSGGIMNLVTIPHPTWVAVTDVLLYLPAAIAGGLLAAAAVLRADGPTIPEEGSISS